MRPAFTLEKEKAIPEEKVEFPRHVRIDGGTALEHKGGGKYYRDAGHWDVHSEWKNGRLLIKSGPSERTHHLNGLELIPCTCEEWAEDNEGYV